jgi:hypothetical protein
MIDPANEVQLSLTAPQPQRRWTVALRLLLVLPHLPWAFALAFVAWWAVFFAWFAAVVTGRMPLAMREFVGRIVQYFTRLSAYLYLLTDAYPPFGLDRDDYPVEAVLPEPTRLSRAAVLFRWLLFIPASIVVMVLGNGIGPVLLVFWVIVLAKRRSPGPVFESTSAVLRYQVRYYAYVLLLTPEYPRGAFGDHERVPVAPPRATPLTVQPAEATAATAPPAEWQPDLAPDVPPPPPPAGPAAGEGFRFTRLTLSKGGRRLVILFIVIGVLATIGTYSNGALNSVRSTNASRSLDRSYDELGQASRAYGTAVVRCAATSAGASCVQDAARDLRAATTSFRHDLRDIDFPAHAVAAAHDLEERTDALLADLRRLSAASAPTELTAANADIQQAGVAFERAYADLQTALHSPS